MNPASPTAESPVRPAPASVLRRVFSFPVFLCFLLAVLALLTVRGRFDDPDLWWHLKNGQVIWTSHVIPTTDQYSYTTNHIASVPEEWLSEVTIYVAYKLVGGYSGLMLWLWFFSTALFISGYGLCCLYSGNAKVAFAGALVVWFFSTVGLAVRGQMIGYLLLIAELALLHLGRSRNRRWFWALPVLFALWVNFHASFFLGLVVLGIGVLSSFFEFQAGSLVSPGLNQSSRRTLILTAIISVAATFLNPVGWRQVFYPVNAFLHQHIVVTQIQEWQPLALSDPRGAGLIAILALVFIYVMVRRESRLLFEELLLLAAGTWLALSHQRMAFVFGILAAPVVCRLFAKSWEGYEPGKDIPAANAVLMAFALVVAFFAFPTRQALAKQVEEQSPVKAVEYIKAHHLSGNMMNTFVDGGYLIWALPEHPVFIDGRADIFEWTGVLREFGKWAMLQTDPNALLDKYHIGFCLLERTSPMSFVLPLMPNWKKVYSDDSSVIFVRTDGMQGIGLRAQGSAAGMQGPRLTP